MLLFDQGGGRRTPGRRQGDARSRKLFTAILERFYLGDRPEKPEVL